MNDPHSRIIFLGPVFFIKRKCSVFTAVAFRQSRVYVVVSLQNFV